MSQIYATHKRKILAGGVLLGTYALSHYINLPNPFYTPGVQNIEKRYSSGGGSKNHIPGAATKLGSYEDVEPNTETSKGIGSPHYQEKIAGQKPDVCGFVFGVLGFGHTMLDVARYELGLCFETLSIIM